MSCFVVSVIELVEGNFITRQRKSHEHIIPTNPLELEPSIPYSRYYDNAYKSVRKISMR